MILLKSKLWRVITIPLVVGGLIGCNSLARLGIALPFGSYAITPINQLSQQNKGTEIYIKGQVGDQAPFLDSAAYQLQDSTGTVWVRTQQNLPSKGKEVVIKAQVDYQSIPLGSQELGEFYVVELEQVTNTEPPSESAPKPTTKPVEELLLPHKWEKK